MKGLKNYLKKFGKMILIDLAFVAAFFVFAGGFLLIVNRASAESFSLLSDLPGLQNAGDTITLGEYVNILFQMAIGLGSVIAVLMIVIGGFQYLSTDMFQTKGAARERITNSLLGLGLLLTSYLILRTINPELLNLDVQLQSAEVGVNSGVYIDTQNIAGVRDAQNAQARTLLADGYRPQSCIQNGFSPGPESSENEVDWVIDNYERCQERRASAERSARAGTTFAPTCVIQSGDEEYTPAPSCLDGFCAPSTPYISRRYSICYYTKED